MKRDLNKELSSLSQEQLALLKAEMQELGIDIDAVVRDELKHTPISKASIQDSYELSSSQKRLYIVEQQNTDNKIAYNMPYALRIEGDLCIAKVKEAFQKIVDRHEALRTSFELQEGVPVQVIQEDVALEIERFDVSEPASIDGVIHSFIRPFELTNAPLIRVGLIELPLKEYILLIDIHHIVADGSSLDILIHEFMTFYQGQELEKPSIQYKDYAVWQSQRLAQKAYEKERTYWIDKFKDDVPVLELPYDFRRPKVQSFQGKRRHFEIDSKVVRKLHRLARETDTTLNMVLYGAFAMLLSKYSNQDDVIIGSPSAGRSQASLNNLIGMFVNTIVTRTKPTSDKVFREYLSEVKAEMIASFDNQDYQFEKLVKDLKIDRKSDRNQLFDVLFAFQNMNVRELKIEGLRIEPYPYEFNMSKFDVSMYCTEVNDALHCSLEYCTELFADATMDRMIMHFKHLLDQIISATDNPISKLKLITPDEAKVILETFNQHQETTIPDETVIDLFEEMAVRHKERVAVVSGERSVTYSEFVHLMDRYAHRLLERGVRKGMYVGVMAERSIELIACIYAILKVGAIYVPMDVQSPLERRTFILKECGIKTLIVDRERYSLLNSNAEEEGLHLLDLFEDHSLTSPVPSVPQMMGEDDAYVIYTSGSTGIPKGVKVKHYNLVNTLRAMQDHYPLKAGDAFMLKTSLAFDVSLSELFGWFFEGGSLVLLKPGDEKEPTQILKAIHQHGVTHINFVPSMLKHFIDAAHRTGIEALESLRYLFSAGEQLTGDLVQAFFDLDSKVQLENIYGPTETTIYSSRYSVKRDDAQHLNVPIGVPLRNTDLFILDKDHHLLPVGVVGELCIAGFGVSSGYLNNPKITAEKFVLNPYSEGWFYKTGDLAKWLPNGDIVLVGRKDSQVKIRGYRIELDEIQHALKKLDYIQDSIVTTHELNGEKALVAHLIKEEDTFDQTALSNLKGEQLDEWKAVWEGIDYASNGLNNDMTVNAKGWIDTFTGKPFKTDDMERWLRQTVERIESFNPKKVLEIGCGTGMILFKIANLCERYVGLDISRAALNYVDEVLNKMTTLKERVVLKQMSADEISGIQETFDSAVINSVVQYFPSIQYLVEVIEHLIPKMNQGGRIFIGDIRNYALHRDFNTMLLYARTGNTLDPKAFSEGVERLCKEDVELNIDPVFFYALKEYLPRIAHVEIKYKKNLNNELGKFRYDAVIHLDEAPTTNPVREVFWTDDGRSLETLEGILQKEAPDYLRLKHIINPLTVVETQLSEAVTHQKLATLPKTLDELHTPAMEWAEYQALLALENHQYHVEVAWAGDGQHRFVDVIYQRNDTLLNSLPTPESYVGNHLGTDWSEFSNNPLEAKFTKNMIPRIKEDLKRGLPAYMIPHHMLLVDAFPLTTSGKIDYKALPYPDSGIRERRKFSAARNQLEEGIVKIWSDVLGLTSVGIDDNFFDLGGHSLKAASLIAQVNRQFDVEVSLGDVFQYPTIRELTDLIFSYEQKKVVQIAKAKTKDLYPVSSAQKRMYTMDHVDFDNFVGNVSGAVLIKGPFDIPLAKKAFNQLIQRHVGLRTGFISKGNEVYQKVYGDVDLDIDIVEEKDPAKLDARVKSFVRKFDLEKPPLFRIGIIRKSAQEHILVYDIHHIISDGNTLAILSKEFTELYFGKTLDIAPYSYIDFSEHYHQLKESGDLEAHRRYWHDKFQDSSMVFDLKTDYQRPALKQFEGDCVTAVIDNDDLQALRDVAARLKTTLHMVLMTAFIILLGKHSEKQEVVIGNAISGRVIPEHDEIVGLFANILPLRFRVEDELAFHQLLQEVKAHCLDSYDHQAYPINELVDDLGLRQDPSRDPYVDVVFNMLNVSNQERFFTNPGHDLSFARYNYVKRIEKRDLTLYLSELDEALRMKFNYSSKLFKEESIQGMCDAYLALLRRITTTAEGQSAI